MGMLVKCAVWQVDGGSATARLLSAEFCSLLTATRLIEERRQGRPGDQLPLTILLKGSAGRTFTGA